jgi:uncharacterized membrane protein
MSDAVREPRRWSFWFVASLCLNFFLIGVIVMGLIVARNRSIAAAVGGGAAGGMRPEVVLQLLPRSGAVKMCNVLSERMSEFRKLGSEVVDARRAMFKLFRTEPFDEGAFRQAMARIAAAEIAVVREREATAAALVVRLTPEERQHFSRAVVRRLLSLRKQPTMQQQRGAIAAICKDLGAETGSLPE